MSRFPPEISKASGLVVFPGSGQVGGGFPFFYFADGGDAEVGEVSVVLLLHDFFEDGQGARRADTFEDAQGGGFDFSGCFRVLKAREDEGFGLGAERDEQVFPFVGVVHP